MPITRLDGKWKNEPEPPAADRIGVAAGLRAKAGTISRLVAED